jgi:hypothetical protein
MGRFLNMTKNCSKKKRVGGEGGFCGLGYVCSTWLLAFKYSQTLMKLRTEVVTFDVTELLLSNLFLLSLRPHKSALLPFYGLA